MNSTKKLYINGQWVSAQSEQTIAVINPVTEATIGTIALANNKDVDSAVHAARKAFSSWQNTSSKERAKYIKAIVEKLSSRQEELAAVITEEQGIPLHFSHSVQVCGPILGLSIYADLAQEMDKTEHLNNSLIIKEPIGVCALITPWNYPLHQLIAKVGPALNSCSK